MEWLTVSETARILKLTEGTIRLKLSDGTIKGQKVGAQWRIEKKEVERYARGIIIIERDE